MKVYTVWQCVKCKKEIEIFANTVNICPYCKSKENWSHRAPKLFIYLRSIEK
jgi:Zn finger protein HypA/HybF involved in hydrogenase expression